MLRRSLATALAVATAGLAAPAGTSAQAMIHVAGGATFPVGEYGDFAELGWLGHAGVAFSVGPEGLAVGAAGYFGSNSHADVDGEATNLYGGLGFVSYALGTSNAASPFLFAMTGLLVHDYDSTPFPELEVTRTGLALGGGAGVAFPLGKMAGFAEAWILNGFFSDDDDSVGGNTTIFGIDVGVQLTVGAGTPSTADRR